MTAAPTGEGRTPEPLITAATRLRRAGIDPIKQPDRRKPETARKRSGEELGLVVATRATTIEMGGRPRHCGDVTVGRDSSSKHTRGEQASHVLDDRSTVSILETVNDTSRGAGQRDGSENTIGSTRTGVDARRFEQDEPTGMTQRSPDGVTPGASGGEHRIEQSRYGRTLASRMAERR